MSRPLPKKARKKLPVIFFMFFSRPLIRGGYTISATNQGLEKTIKKITGSFFLAFLGRGIDVHMDVPCRIAGQ
jgi:hypothetical protein